MDAIQGVSSYREMLLGNRFYYGVEVVTTRGLAVANSPADTAATAKALLEDPRIGWISVTDNPGGGPMLPPDWLAGSFPQCRERIVVHLSCKDLNRNGLEAAAWRYGSEGYHNILALTGDYPTTGFHGTAHAVFDFDSLALITLLRSMNEGLQVPDRRGGVQRLAPTNFFIGCAVSPFKRHERELMPQYFKLLRKIAAGAQWVIPQLGYDMRKFHEIKLLLAAHGIDVPVVGNVYLLTKAVAGMFHAGKLAGCVVSDQLLEAVNKYAAGPDKGRKFFRELAAKQLAVFKGLGFAAGYLGGMAKPETFGEIVDMAESFAADDWRQFLKEIQFAQPDEFFLFEHDPQSGLSTPDRINPAYLASLEHPAKSKHVTLGYRISRRVHNWGFSPGKGLYGLMQRLFRRWDKRPGLLGRAAYRVESTAKRVGYDCQECGDCSLPDCAYLCPAAACSKQSRNGPCGGSADGLCELKDKDCFWTRVYERLKYYGESEHMLDFGPVFVNTELKRTSSWANTFLGRDHHAPAAGDVQEKAQQDAPKKA